MTMSIDVAGSDPTRQRAPGSAVRSHESYEPAVQSVCHHSGRYLTVEETNPERSSLLRGQYDFPGLKALDDRFQGAAHARFHQHLVWIRPAVQGMAMLIAAALSALAAILVWSRREQWYSLPEGIALYVGLGAATLVGLSFAGVGLWLLSERNTLYHRGARGQRPAIDDFPLLGAYRIDVREEYALDIDTSRREVALPTRGIGKVTVDVIPAQDIPELCRGYCAAYQSADVGSHLHAGTVAFEGLAKVEFDPDIEYRHRMALRQPVAEQFAPSGEPSCDPVRFEAPYKIDATVMAPGAADEQRRLRFDLSPRLEGFGSYTLQLHIRWLGAPTECGIEECRLFIPPELGRVWRVEHGRYVDGDQGPEVIWRNLALQDGELRLSMTVSMPLLQTVAPPTIRGSYRFLIGQSIAGLHVPLTNIWDARGRSWASTNGVQPSVTYLSTVSGNLDLHVALLAQEHEFVCDDRRAIAEEPGYPLTEHLARILSRVGVDIQRIEEAMPRLDPVGSLEHELSYWDIIGRCYEPVARESADVHLVVHGTRTVTAPARSARTVVDVRVRCLHDPRSRQLIEFSRNIHELIMTEIDHELPPAGPPAPPASPDGGSV